VATRLSCRIRIFGGLPRVLLGLTIVVGGLVSCASVPTDYDQHRVGAATVWIDTEITDTTRDIFFSRNLESLSAFVAPVIDVRWEDMDVLMVVSTQSLSELQSEQWFRRAVRSRSSWRFLRYMDEVINGHLSINEATDDAPIYLNPPRLIVYPSINRYVSPESLKAHMIGEFAASLVFLAEDTNDAFDSERAYWWFYFGEAIGGLARFVAEHQVRNGTWESSSSLNAHAIGEWVREDATYWLPNLISAEDRMRVRRIAPWDVYEKVADPDVVAGPLDWHVWLIRTRGADTYLEFVRDVYALGPESFYETIQNVYGASRDELLDEWVDDWQPAKLRE
jgi:hypothetical protein